MKIRKIEKEDAESLFEMQFELDKETKYMLYEPNERPRNLNVIKGHIDSALNGTNLLLVAEENKEVVGFLVGRRGQGTRVRHTVYIVVGIREAYRGKGIGSEFFRQLDLWAKENSITRLELTVVIENEIALKLYKKNGFEIEGIKKNSMIIDGKYVDEYYMGKVIGEEF